jgi:hypothetical protein
VVIERDDGERFVFSDLGNRVYRWQPVVRFAAVPGCVKKVTGERVQRRKESTALDLLTKLLVTEILRFALEHADPECRFVGLQQAIELTGDVGRERSGEQLRGTLALLSSVTARPTMSCRNV